MPYNMFKREPRLIGDLLREMKVIRPDGSVDIDLLAAYMREDIRPDPSDTKYADQ